MGKAARIQNRETRRPTAAQQRRSVWNKRFGRPQMMILAALIMIGAVVIVLTRSSPSSLPWSVFPETNHQHVTGNVVYDHSPPAGGAHDGVWLNCGVYTSPVRVENAVHSLEHGSVWITYSKKATAEQISQLTGYVQTHYFGSQRYLILSPYAAQTSPFVATAWGAQLRFDHLKMTLLQKFVTHYQGGAQGTEQGASCTGGTGTPSS